MRNRFLINTNKFPVIKNISHLKMAWVFIWTNLNPLYTVMLCAKCSWNWPRGFKEGKKSESFFFPTDNGHIFFYQKSSLEPSAQVSYIDVKPLTQPNYFGYSWCDRWFVSYLFMNDLLCIISFMSGRERCGRSRLCHECAQKLSTWFIILHVLKHLLWQNLVR